jgi:hypothetical protein
VSKGKSYGPGEFCPLVKGACVRDACAFWTEVRGTHPQTGVEISQPACAVAWIPLLMIDQTQQIRHQAAAADQARNAVATIQLADRLNAVPDRDSVDYG